MKTIDEMLAFNRHWAGDMKTKDPLFFSRHADGQKPAMLLIGCSDSRIPISSSTGIAPGEMFVYRNIANQMHGADLGAQAVLAYAVDALRVQHIIVAGHSGCGGVAAAIADPKHGIVDHWLSNARLLALRYEKELDALPSREAQLDRLVQLNVVLQIYALSMNPTVRDAWANGRKLLLHGLVYELATGLLETVVRDVDGLDTARQKLAVFRPG